MVTGGETERRRRLLLGAAGALLLVVLAGIALEFLGALTFAVFLYYSTRPIYRYLRRFGLPRRIRAVLAITIFSVPFVALLAYLVVIVLIEARLAIERYDLETEVTDWIEEQLDVDAVEVDEIGTQLSGLDLEATVQLALALLTEGAGIVASVAVQLFLVFVLLYYLLIDGARLREWTLETFDGSGVLTVYSRRVDGELSAVLFGNIINAFLTAIVGIVVFHAYNLVAPPAVSVPFPALVGALTGIGSLIPVVGMKLVYVPIALALGAVAILTGEGGLLLYVVVFVAITFVLVDTIPDLFIRPFVSGKDTHIGLLMLAYVIGPIVFGFYGVFLGPILLVLGIQFVRVVLPYVLSGDLSDEIPGPPEPRQAALSEFEHPKPPLLTSDSEPTSETD